MKKTVTEYIADFLVTKKLNTIFAVTGASAIRIIDSIGRRNELRYICPHHEQAGAMAAIGHYRKTGQVGVMVVTAGPGGANAITGVASAYLDSIPLIVLAGQEKLFFTKDNLRGKGVQGLPLTEMVRPVVKSSVTLQSEKDIVGVMEEAYRIAISGRPGPVWIDIPQDLQNVEFEVPEVAPKDEVKIVRDLSSEISKTLKLIKESERPLIWLGHGIRISKSEEKLLELLEYLKVPVLTAWNGADLLYESHPCYFGRAGTYGNRYANFILQNCDLLITLGTRIAIPQLGYSHQEFSRAAKKVIVEIDPSEFEKFTFPIEVKVVDDVSNFIDQLLLKKDEFKLNITNWFDYCEKIKEKYPPVTKENRNPIPDKVNSYHFIDELSNLLTSDDDIVTDMGTSLTCTHAAIRLKKGQRLITSTGLGEMGFGLPCAIGVALGSNKNRRTVFIGAEGSLMMNLQEFQTVVHHKLPIKIFILNNDAYLTIFHTENAMFGGDRLSACTNETGVSFPDLSKVAPAFGLKYAEIKGSNNLKDNIQKILETPGSILCNVFMPQDQFLGPKSAVKFDKNGHIYSPPLEDLAPFLPQEEIEQNMLITMLKERS